MQLYGDFTKYEEQADGTLIVQGFASTESMDRQGEVVSAQAMRDAVPIFMRDPALREMHQPIAAGVPLEMTVGEDGKTFAKAHVVDKGSIAKVKAGVLRGFSIGGSALTKVGNTVERLLLRELSLVDRACNPDCQFTVAKVDSTTNFMEHASKTDFDTLKNAVEGLITTVKNLADKPAPQLSLVAKVDGKDVSFDGATIHGLIAKVDGLVVENAALKTAVVDNTRADVIAKMDKEGRNPINPDTGVAYKLDELQKLDLPTLKIVAANAPVVPLAGRASLLKSDTKTLTIDPNLKGSERTAATWDNAYPSLAAANAKHNS